MQTKLGHYPAKPKSEETFNAYVIVCRTYDASSSFLDIFEKTRKARGAKGAPTDEEQDVLRAMLTFATSGLDSMVKQLVRDALPSIINTDQGATKMFKGHVESKIKRADQLDFKFLAAVLVEERPRESLVRGLVHSLTSSSLQSKDELLKVAAYFNIPSKDLSKNIALLDRIFGARNEISHEMDIDFAQPNRNRRPRRRKEMVEYTQEILRLSEAFLTLVDKKLWGS